ncbi:hypothetical protein [Cecembia lonarensis]|uniref:Uncharacterized protein n=1 Tax=Cecembia lonarensis (strain CCUG 58316 / KCTC 22772 / LW9) TaxID=1225176 RepID=K1L6M7_CECL9|nr:hypothetical protein [Cecembia lonarensis]EKB47722.1 hypothetical protein B879_03668 [Cecembia lonarensis LW9]
MSDKNGITPTFPMQMRGLLLLTGMYNIAWAAFFKYFGEDFLRWLSMDSTWTGAMQSNWFGGMGMVSAFLVFLSAFYPISWRYLTWAGILGSLVLSFWFLIAFIPELGWNKRTIFQLVFNQLLWLIPLSVISIRAIEVKKYIETIEK